MKNKTLYLILVLISYLFLSSCEQTVYINQQGYEPRVAVESDIAADSVPKIYLTLTQNYYGYVDYKAPVTYIENATVLMIHNGVADEMSLTEGRTDTITTYSTNGGKDTIYTKRKYYRGHTPCVKGEKYSLQISYEGKEVSSELTAPNFIFEPLQAEQIYQEVQDPSGWSYTDIFLEIRVKDHAGVGNYYRAKIGYTATNYVSIYNPVTQEYEWDTVVTYQQEISDIISDEINDGGIIKFKMYPMIIDTGYVPVHIQVECLDNTVGRYWEAVKQQQNSNGDPFTEPTILYSNIKNGVGFFGAYQIVDTLTFMYKGIY